MLVPLVKLRNRQINVPYAREYFAGYQNSFVDNPGIPQFKAYGTAIVSREQLFFDATGVGIKNGGIGDTGLAFVLSPVFV